MIAWCFLQGLLILGATLAPGDFTVRTAAGVTEAVRAQVESLVRSALADLAPRFAGTPTRSITIWVHRDARSLSPEVRRDLHEGTAGLALLGRDEIHVLLEEARSAPPGDLRTVVRHELVHVLLDQYCGTGAPFVSRWFHEGLAQELSGGPYLGLSEQDLLAATVYDRLIPFSELHDDFPEDPARLRRAYAQSFSFVAYLVRELGLATLLEAARRSEPNGGFRAGFVAVTGSALVEHEAPWREYVRSGSGAGMRLVLQNCFAYTMIAAFVLLALAGIRVWRRDAAARAKLEREDSEPTL